MLNNPQEITDFKDYQAAGGIQKPKSYDVANKTIKAASGVYGAFSGCVDSELNYNTDGIIELPELITQIGNEAKGSGEKAKVLIAYLDLAANPTDLEQVSIGVDIICKLASIENNKPAPSIVPITDPSLITQLQNVFTDLNSHVPDVTTLMAKINAAITPPPLPPTPLPADLKKQALAMIEVLKPFSEQILESSVNVNKLVSSATSERNKALLAFNDCIAFTMLSSQKEKPSISNAANELYPI